jgi:hypothetical protein
MAHHPLQARGRADATGRPARQGRVNRGAWMGGGGARRRVTRGEAGTRPVARWPVVCAGLCVRWHVARWPVARPVRWHVARWHVARCPTGVHGRSAPRRTSPTNTSLTQCNTCAASAVLDAPAPSASNDTRSRGRNAAVPSPPPSPLTTPSSPPLATPPSPPATVSAASSAASVTRANARARRAASAAGVRGLMARAHSRPTDRIGSVFTPTTSMPDGAA